MNISELARKLKIDPQRLREMLPRMGFDVGGHAIQIDDRTARKILDNWRQLYRQWEFEKKKEDQAAQAEKDLARAKIEGRDKVRVPKFITVRDFSTKLGVPVNSLMRILMKNGVLASLNDRIDFETALIIGDDLGYKVENETEGVGLQTGSEETVKDAVKASANLQKRPPVVVVMGHVDHGKTKILDAIRSTNVVAGEAGGITQHIGAYETQKNGRTITFIDTPGHEAFTAMRSRGAKIADIAVIVVAADDGVQPQTREVADIVTAAKIPFLVAVNKIDKPDADPEKAKREMSEINIIPEDWGGKTPFVPVSAKTGQGIDTLLETILLVADMQEKEIVADPAGETVSSVIESHIDKGEGVVATLLIQNGTLKVNDYLKIGNILYGRVRAMKDWLGKDVREAGPSKPVKILGLKLAPEVGDVIIATQDTKNLEKNVKKTEGKRPHAMAYETKKESETEEKEILNIILKTDVLGSAEAILGSLEQFKHRRLAIKVVGSGLGNINKADVDRAESSHAAIYGFNVRVDQSTEDHARQKGVDLGTFQIIYDLLDAVKEKLESMLTQEVIRKDVGKLKVLAIFRREKENQIIGGRVTQGKVANDANFEIFRADVRIDEGAINRVQLAKQDVSEVAEPNECGLQIKCKQKIEEGDILMVYKEERKEEKVKL